MPKVSVVIPNYNHARFLEQRIDSVLNQTFQDFEIIFLDDLSTDNSKEILAKYANHPKIGHRIFNDTNSNSTFKQWNKGIGLATGEYIWIAESDDYAAPGFLEKLVPILDRDLNVGLAYCQSYLVDETSKILSPNFLACTDCFDRQRWLSNYLNHGKNECENFLAGKNTIPNASAVLIRKSVYLSEVDCDNEAFKVAGDWFTWSKILLAADVYFVAESLNYFRSCEGSVSRKTAKLLLIVRESLLIFSQFQERVTVSRKARQVFFDLVSSWWIGYYITGDNSPWNKETEYFQQLLVISPDRISSLSFYWQSLLIPFKRFRYMLKLGTRVSSWKAQRQHSLSNNSTSIKSKNY
jgi:glycosyltransferase involved in cell wall biosynthesis